MPSAILAGAVALLLRSAPASPPDQLVVVCSDGGLMTSMTVSLQPTLPGDFIAVGLFSDGVPGANAVIDSAGNLYTDQGGGCVSWCSDLWYAQGSNGGVTSVTGMLPNPAHLGMLVAVYPAGTVVETSGNATTGLGCGNETLYGTDAGDVLLTLAAYSVSTTTSAPGMTSLASCAEGELFVSAPVDAGTVSFVFTPAQPSAACGFGNVALAVGTGNGASVDSGTTSANGDAGLIDDGGNGGGRPDGGGGGPPNADGGDAGKAQDAGNAGGPPMADGGDAGLGFYFASLGCGCSAAPAAVWVAALFIAAALARRKRSSR